MDEVNPSTHEGDQSSTSSYLSLTRSTWCPSQLVFVPYVAPAMGRVHESQNLNASIRKSLVSKLTRDLVETYKLCNSQFKYSNELKLKRFFTSPSNGVLNDGHDNINSDLILSVNLVLLSSGLQRRYIVKDMLGQGTFGQVAKCWVAETSSFVAVKIIKNQPAYYQQALVEVSILKMLNEKYDPVDNHHIVRIYDYFVYQSHLCIAFELLDSNLYELIKMNKLRGLTLNIVQLFSKQILCGLALMKDAGIIHCDLKPENILLCPGLKPPEIKPPKLKIIDFGSACMEERTVYSYIQSRYYRSPEVLLGYPYTSAIDMWSFGCIVAELFLGIPLFPGASEFDILRRMIRILGGQPPNHLLKEAKNASKFFKCIGNFHYKDGENAYQVLTEEEYEAREKKKPSIAKEYFNFMNLEAIVTSYPYKKTLNTEDIAKENQIRLALIDFLKGLMEFDPVKRWSPSQASKHPFITGEPFTCPYQPPLETPRMPVSQIFKVNHHPAGGHWFAAGLSPNILARNQFGQQNGPNFQVGSYPYTHAHSYGSLGSHGSFGDNSNTFAAYSPVGPSAMNLHHAPGGMAVLGSSPDTRRIISQFPHGGGGLGVSPSAGNFTALPLGTSPSQYTPPSSNNQGHFGPTSPARGTSHGSPLGKTAASSQFNRRNNWGNFGNLQSQGSSAAQHWHGHSNDGSSSSQAHLNSQTFSGSHSHMQVQSNNYGSSRKQQRGDGGTAGSYPTTQDPADWFSIYSDDALLHPEDGPDASNIATEFRNGMHLGQTSLSGEQLVGIGKFNRALNPTSISSNRRTNGAVPSFPHANAGIPPLAHDPHTRFTAKPPQFTHHSRLGQNPIPFNHGNSPVNRGSEWNNSTVSSSPGYNYVGQQHSPSSSQMNNGLRWGRKGNNPATHSLPTSHGPKDYGRIS